jgi:hypothetical protein
MTMTLPDTYTAVNETGCCAVPAIDGWNDRVVEFLREPFIAMDTKTILHIPLNMAHVMTELSQIAAAADATPPPERLLILSQDLSPWKTRHLYRVSHPVEGANNVELTGKFVTRVFEGPYQNAKDWAEELEATAIEYGGKSEEIYFFYTTCPSCAEHYGKNYVVGFSRLM